MANDLRMWACMCVRARVCECCTHCRRFDRYSDLKRYLHTLTADGRNDGFLRIEPLCKTLAGNTCPLLTVCVRLLVFVLIAFDVRRACICSSSRTDSTSVRKTLSSANARLCVVCVC